MMVNLIPYLKDGEIQLTVTKVMGQDYGDEYGMGPNGCTLPNSFDALFNINTSYDYYPGASCAHYLLATIKGGSVSTYVEYIRNKYNRTDAAPLHSEVRDMYEHYCVNFGSPVFDVCSLLASTSSGGTGLLMHPQGHIYLYYGFKRAGVMVPKENVQITKYDTSSPTWVTIVNAGSVTFEENYLIQ